MARKRKHSGQFDKRTGLLDGLTNLETGERAEDLPTNYPSMTAAATVLSIDVSILKEARAKGCPAFQSSGSVNREKLIAWLVKNPHTPIDLGTPPEEDELTDLDQPSTDEPGSVGQTLSSLQKEATFLKRKLDGIERATNLHPRTKMDLAKGIRAEWASISRLLLMYELKVSMAKRESGELIPLTDAVKAVQALLAWHTVATSDALRNVIPLCELKTKYEIAAVLDPALRSAIYRNFDLGVKLGKIPDWMGKSASDFVRGEELLSVGPKGEAPKDVNVY